MIKLWGNYEGGRGQEFWNTTGIQVAYLSFLWASWLLLFSMDGIIMMLSQKSLKGEKVFLNVQNIRADNFNLVKSLRNICNEFISLLKNEHKDFFSKYYSLYLKDIAFF